VSVCLSFWLSTRVPEAGVKLPRKLLRKAVGVPGAVAVLFEHRACPLPSHKPQGRGIVGDCGHRPQRWRLSGLEILGLIEGIDFIRVLRFGFLKLLFWVFCLSAGLGFGFGFWAQLRFLHFVSLSSSSSSSSSSSFSSS